MQSFDLICLANSRKLGARCIAGIRADTGEWVRPVSASEHGELLFSQRKVADDEPRNFDLLRIGLAKHSPSNGQPENWLIDGSPWQLISRPAPNNLRDVLEASLYRSALLFGSASDCIDARSFAVTPIKESLALAKPETVHWETARKYGGAKQARVAFRLGGTTYDLAVTDPPYETKLKALDVGYHQSAEIGIAEEGRLLFTISLGEPFSGYCYKLVAGVLELPAGWSPIT